MKLKFSKLLLFIAICEGAGLIGSAFTFSAIPGWYVTLNKPAFNPPNNIFGPVWTMLYLLMGISVYLIWVSGKKSREVLRLFWIHLFFNVTWSIMFFGFKSPILGLINILTLWVLIVVVIYKFWKINRTAGLLLLPYLGWVSFATFLNYNIWLLNK
ncbi:MAG: TspO/MBR family protein [Candidatus Daviesbacteria bacterium]|nr:TspO/MBR family protein [Candidatus Daviesbacteria bacterium]